MGAFLPDRKIDSPLLDPPEPAAPEGFLLPAARPDRTSRQSPERETRISGLALRTRACPSARGLPEGTRRWAGHRWQSGPEGFATCGASTAPR